LYKTAVRGFETERGLNPKYMQKHREQKKEMAEQAKEPNCNMTESGDLEQKALSEVRAQL
jgi:hypothetical protein